MNRGNKLPLSVFMAIDEQQQQEGQVLRLKGATLFGHIVLGLFLGF